MISWKVRIVRFLVSCLQQSARNVAQSWCLRNVHCMRDQVRFLAQSLMRDVRRRDTQAGPSRAGFPLTGRLVRANPFIFPSVKWMERVRMVCGSPQNVSQSSCPKRHFLEKDSMLKSAWKILSWKILKFTMCFGH